MEEIVVKKPAKAAKDSAPQTAAGDCVVSEWTGIGPAFHAFQPPCGPLAHPAEASDAVLSNWLAAT